MARPQPSLRFADGGSFITRWAKGVMRPNATADRLREIESPASAPAPAAPPPPPPPPPNPRVTRDNPAGIRFQDGGGLSKEAVMAAIARQRAAQGGQQERPRQDQQPRQEQPKERSGVGALATDFLRNPGGVLKSRMQAAGLEFQDGGSFGGDFYESLSARKAEAQQQAEDTFAEAQDRAIEYAAKNPGQKGPVLMQDGGHVPGTGEGDKIPAKYEPGEFVVSNDMIDDNPGLREQLSGLRAETLAARGKTVEEADAKAMRHAGSLRAADGFDPLDRMQRQLTGQNSLPPRSPVGNMAQDLERNARAAPPPFDPNRNFAAPNNGLPPGPSSSTVHGAPAPVNAPTNGLPPGPSSEYPRSIKAPTGGLPPGPSSSLAGGPAAAAAEALHGERVNPTLRPNNAAFHGDGRYGAPAGGPSNAATTALGEANAATRAASGVPGAPSAAGKWFGTADDWKGMVGSQKGSLRMSPTAAPGMLGKGLLGVQGAVGAYNAYEGIQEGDALKTGLGAADVAATGALLTPAAPAAAAYLGVRGAWEGGKAAGDYIGSKFSDKTRDAIGGTINQIGLNTGLWGTDDSAYLQQQAANPTPSAGPAAAPSNSLRVRPGDRLAGPPAPGEGRSPVGDTVITDGGVGPGNVTRRGNEYSGTNVSGPITINGMEPGFGMNMSGPNAQNMAAADNLAARETLRGQQSMGSSQYDREVQQAQATNAMQQRLYSKPEGTIQDGLMSRTPDQQRRDAAVSASSIHQRTREGGQAELKALDQKTQDRLRDGTARYAVDQQAESAKYGVDTAAATSRYNSENSLRGDFAKAGADRRGAGAAQYAKEQERAAYADIYKRAGGNNQRAAQLAEAEGYDGSRYLTADGTRQTQDFNASKNATERLKGMAGGADGKIDEVRLNQLRTTATKMFPGWEQMSEDKQTQNLGKVEAGVNLLEGMNDRRNHGFLQSIGWDGTSPSLDTLPKLKGGVLSEVGAVEGGLRGGGVSRKDWKISVGGHDLYIPRGKAGEKEFEFLKEMGVDISGAKK